MSKPRITAVLKRDAEGEAAEVLLYLNPEGRDLLVRELLDLNERSEHFHIQPEECAADLPLQMKAYTPANEFPVHHVKVMYRLDAWDEKYYPHVMSEDKPSV